MLPESRPERGRARPAEGAAFRRPSPSDAIAIHDVTASPLDARFDVQRGAAGFILHGERAYGMDPRTLLGATTACVGRDREIATLDAMFAGQWLSTLVDREVVVRRPPSGAGASTADDGGEPQPAGAACLVGGEPAYRFRHSILR